MDGRDECDLVLFGFRNDVARERVLEYLATLPDVALVDRTTPVPQRLYAQLSAQRAHQLRLRLESLGAQIRVVPFNAPSPATIDPPAPPFATALRTATLVLLAILLVFTALALHRTSLPNQGGPEARLGVPFTTAALQPIEPPRQPAAQPHADAEALQLNAAAVEMAQRGEHEGAAERLRQALRLVPDQPVLRQNLQAVLLNAGRRALDAGRPAEALNSLREALALGERSDVRQVMGVARLQAGEFGEARADLERAVAGGAKDATTWLALGEAYLHENDRTHALECLQHARDAGARGPQLDALVERLGREIDAEWDFTALESPHFRASFADGENRRAAQFVLEGLEDARRAVGSKFAALPDGRAEVVLYAAQDFHAVTQTPDWAGGAYDGRIKVPVRGLDADDAALARLLRHEYMHHAVAELSHNRCPVWLSEGLAVWAEEEQDGERRTWAEDTLHGAALFHLRDLAGPLTSLPPQRALVAYAQSYLAVRELIDRYGARKLPQLVGELSRQPLPAAFAAVYPGELADFEERWLRSLNS